ncbi:hypothetical protein DX910_00430 [Acinetobacter haemolyticus]|nr:hypothetical protein DX910_00430 [Acinetobacter haemolyticus]
MTTQQRMGTFEDLMNLQEPKQDKKSNPKMGTFEDLMSLQMKADPKSVKDLGTLKPMQIKAVDAGKPSAAKSFILGAANKVGGGINQGASSFKDLGSSLINNAFGTNLKTDRYDEVTKQTKAVNDAYELSRSKAGQKGTDLWSLAGEVAATLPAGAAGVGRNLIGTAAKSAAVGAGIGGASFAENADQRISNIKGGATGGALGGVAAKGITKIANRSAEKVTNNAINKVLDAPKNQLVKDAKAAGYTIPPSYSNPNVLNKSLAKIAGEADLAKIASSKNQEATNALAKQSLGLPINKPLTESSLQAVRQEASQAYDIVRSLGKVKVDQTFKNDIDSIVKPYIELANDFPLEVTDDVVKSLRQAQPKNGEFEAGAAIQAIRSLRLLAKKAFKADNDELGMATKSAAEALEKQLDRAVGRSSLNPNAIANFKNARKLIAKTHTIEDAMDEVGDVSAIKLASMMGKGAPLSGELKQAAQFASVYPQLNNVGRSGGEE